MMLHAKMFSSVHNRIIQVKRFFTHKEEKQQTVLEELNIHTHTWKSTRMVLTCLFAEQEQTQMERMDLWTWQKGKGAV